MEAAMYLLTLGLNHTTAPVAVRERVSFPGEGLRDALADMRGSLRTLMPEGAILSTCNRTEIYCATESPGEVPPALSGCEGTRATFAIQKFAQQPPDSGRTNTQLPGSIFDSSRLRAFALGDRGLQTPQYSSAAGAFRAFDLTEFQLWVCDGLHQEYTRPPYSRISVKTLTLRVKLTQ